MEIIRHIKVDLYGDTQHFAVAAKQMDMGTRYIGVTLMEDGVVYEIPDNVEVIINMTKPDKTHVHNDGEKSGNEALIPLTRGMLQVHGTALCEVQLYQNGALLTEKSPSQTSHSSAMHRLRWRFFRHSGMNRKSFTPENIQDWRTPLQQRERLCKSHRTHRTPLMQQRRSDRHRSG